MKKLIPLLPIFFFAGACSAQEPNLKSTECNLKVFVTDLDSVASVGGDQISFVSQKDEKKYTGITDSTGRFSIIVPHGETFKILCTSFGSDQDYAEFALPTDTVGYNMEFTIMYELPTSYILENLYFETGSAWIKSASHPSLDNLVNAVKLKKGLIIEIGGHTDNVGENDYNIGLSERRAQAVRTYLIDKGVSEEKVLAKGYGPSNPISTNETEEGRANNRRTEVTILSNKP